MINCSKKLFEKFAHKTSVNIVCASFCNDLHNYEDYIFFVHTLNVFSIFLPNKLHTYKRIWNILLRVNVMPFYNSYPVAKLYQISNLFHT